MTTMTRKEQQQDLICRVTGDAPMGALLQRYWWPALKSEEIAEPDGTPVRVRILGRNLVAFRTTDGTAGIIDERCPHRLASLALGRNEEGGLRCIYHGWKFGTDGSCLDMPTEPEGYNFRERMRVRSFPIRETGGLIWTYLGPAELEPQFPAFDWTQLPRNQFAVLKFVEHANYVQAVEGALDTAHVRILHQGAVGDSEEAARNRVSRDLAPKLECADTCYGFRYVALRRPNENPDSQRAVKMSRFVFPTTTIFSQRVDPDEPAPFAIFVPIDDENTVQYMIYRSTNGKPVDETNLQEQYQVRPGIDLDEYWRPRRNLDNWYQQDRAAMKNGSFTGIKSLLLQDVAVQETMGTLTDHSAEHLGTSDLAIIRLRRLLLESVQRFQAGREPIGLNAAFNYADIVPLEERVISIADRWQALQAFENEYVTG